MMNNKNRKEEIKEKLINALLWILTIAMIIIGVCAIAFEVWIDIAWKLSIIG